MRVVRVASITPVTIPTMHHIGFRQFNTNGVLENVNNDVILTPDVAPTSISPSEWYDVIRNDDVTAYDDIMSSYTGTPLRLLHGKFTFTLDPKLEQIARITKAECRFENSFILACSFGSKQIVEKMLQDGVDVRIRERTGITFVHALIQAVEENPDQEQMMVDMYDLVIDNTNEDIRRELLTVEDEEGYRPLELAVRIGAYGMFKIIFNTVGAYREHEPVGQLGLHTFIQYDVSDYENFKNRFRELRSPLRLMNFMSESHLRSYLKFDVHSMPVVQSWREKKIRHALPIIAVWYALKFLFVTTVVLMDASRINHVRKKENKTDVHPLSTGSPHVDDGLIAFMAIFGAIIFFVALVLNVKQLLDCERRTVDSHVKRISYLTHTDFFTYVQVIMCGLVVIQYAMAYGGASLGAIHGAKAVLIPFGLLSYLHIMMVVPYIDRFVIALTRMVTVLVKFVVIHIAVRMVFCLFIMNTESGHPTQNFGNINDAFYGIFLLDLSIIQLEAPFYSQFTHMAFFYVSGVLLINYLIAVMTDLASEVNDYGVIYCDLTKLELAYQAQENFGRFIWAKCTTEFDNFLIVKIEDSKSMRLHDKEAAKTLDTEKYDI